MIVNLSSTSVFVLALHYVTAMAIDARELVAEDNTAICGGSLVTKDMVLTAAHCEFQHASKVLVGALCKPYGPNDANNCNQKVEFIEIEEVFNHDKYNGKNLDYDYALVKLKEKSSINPVGLDIIGKGNRFNRGHELSVAGFGTLNDVNIDLPNRLRKTEVKFVPSNECKTLALDNLTSRMMCAYDNGKDSCQGDSGGPLVDKNPASITINNGADVVLFDELLVGVVSHGGSNDDLCDNPDYKGIYSKITDQKDWIKRVICEHASDKPAYLECPDGGSCMSGNVGLMKVTNPSEDTQKNQLRRGNLQKKEPSISVTKLTDLHVGDFIQGFDEQLQPTTCKVEAIGQFGHGPLYGNYTDDHFIYNPTTNMVEEHGVDGVPESDITTEDKYEILTDCPLGVDEAGTKFTPIDSDFCGSHLTKLSWSDYILLHKGILRVVRETGTFWFQGSSYPDFERLQEHAPRVCETMLQCMKDEEECHHLEKASVYFIENVLMHSVRNKAYSAFHNIGRHRELGSVAAAVSGGKSVRN